MSFLMFGAKRRIRIGVFGASTDSTAGVLFTAFAIAKIHWIFASRRFFFLCVKKNVYFCSRIDVEPITMYRSISISFNP